jgi:hypothetical protein
VNHTAKTKNSCYIVPRVWYHIILAGYFRKVQNFAFFADKLGAAKIRIANLAKTRCHTCNQSTWSSSEGLTCNFMKFAPAKISRYTVIVISS